MTEQHVRKQLQKMLASFTPGSVLGIMAGIYREAAEEASKENDAILYERCKNVERTLVVVGMGIDAACPR
jgi:hypothetical protein